MSRHPELLDLLRIRGATLDERFAEQVVRGVAATTDPSSGERLERWRGYLERVSAGGLARRLAWSGLPSSDAALRRALGRVEPTSSAAPPWVARAAWLSRAISEGPLRAAWVNEIAFGAVFAPIAEAAERELCARVPAYADRFSRSAKSRLKRWLVELVGDALARPLELEFSMFRIRSGKRPDQVSPHETQLYDAFVAGLVKDGADVFLVEYAAATREACALVDAWLRNIGELCVRCDREARTVVEIEPGLSDPHHGYRTVHRVRFSDGVTLYYKPRPGGMETLLPEIVRALGIRGADDQPLDVVCATRDAGDHAWSVAIGGAAERSSEYWWNAGALLAISYALGGADLHDENVIATRERPIVVDAELFATPVPERHQTGARTGSPGFRSVLRTGLLPRWVVYGDGTAIQIGGISGRLRSQQIPRSAWQHVGSDAMRIVRAEHPAVATRTSFAAVAPLVLAGFDATYLTIARSPARVHREIQERIAAVPVRVLVRDTSLYATLRSRLCHPRFCREGVDRDLELEPLLSAFVEGPHAPAIWPMLLDERRQLLELDVPYFEVRADRRTWSDGEVRECAIFVRSGVEEIAATIAGLGDRDRAMQGSLIRAALFTSDAFGDHRFEETASPRSYVHAGQGAAAGPLPTAVRIGELLLETAVDLGDEGLTWFGASLDHAAQRYSVDALPRDLYDGLAGVAVFLARLGRATGEPEPRRAALRIAHALASADLRPFESNRGGAIGPLSIAYALAHVAHATERHDLSDAAVAIAERCADPPRDAPPDLLTGIAGEMSCLYALSPTRFAPRIAELAARLEAFDLAELATGASHGAAGIAFALERCCPGDDAARALASRLRRAESDRFDAAIANWPRNRQPTPHVLDNWCYGAPGIVHLRHASPVPAHPWEQAQLDAALDRLARREVGAWDHVAAGNAGAMIALAAAGRIDAARRVASAVIERAGPGLDFRIPGDGAPTPGLFTGLAGIGLALLFVASPDRSSDVLAWKIA